MSIHSKGFVPTRQYIKDWLKQYMKMDPRREQGDVVTEDQLQSFYDDVMHAKLV